MNYSWLDSLLSVNNSRVLFDFIKSAVTMETGCKEYAMRDVAYRFGVTVLLGVLGLFIVIKVQVQNMGDKNR